MLYHTRAVHVGPQLFCRAQAAAMGACASTGA
eukprot:SAG22_NODE_21964_length_252_cov_1.019608_1_plen_31_part_10